MIVTTRIRSTDIEQSQLISYWQDHLCKLVIQSHCSVPGEGRALYFDLLHYATPRAQVTWLRDSPQRVTRAAEHVKRSTGHHVAIMIQHRGETQVRCAGLDMTLRAGDVGLVADWRPSITSAEDFVEQTVLMLPLDQMRALLPQAPDLRLVRLEGAHHSTRLVQIIAKSLHAQLKIATGAASADHFQQALIQAVAGACMAQGAVRLQSGSRLEHFYYETMEAFIRARLTSPDLSPGTVANHVGISTSHGQRVYRLFGQTIGKSIREKRLAAAQGDMLNPSFATLSLQEIADKSGFYDAAHFSRVFRQVHDMSPGAWRQMRLRCEQQSSD